MKSEWQCKQIGDVCDVIAGQSPEGKFYNTVGDGTPFYQGKKDFGEKFIEAPTTWTTRATKIARKGDILISVRAPVGPVNLATHEACIGRGLAVIRGRANVNRDFLFYQLLHLQPEIAGKQGAVFESISKSAIEALPIAFAALPEQRRIVAILDEAFEDLATAKANAERNLQNARAIFESHLQFVFTRHRDDWVPSKLKSLTTKIGSGATPRGGEASYKREGVSLIRSLNVHDVRFRYLKLVFLDDAQAEELSNVQVQRRDVLLNITGASVARCCIVPEDVLPARVNQHVSIIRPIADRLDAGFLHYLLISKPYKDRLLQTGAEGGSTRQAITKGQIEDFSIMSPVTLNEQKSIAGKLDALLTETQCLELLYQQKHAALNELRKALLHQAFSGQL